MKTHPLPIPSCAETEAAPVAETVRDLAIPPIRVVVLYDCIASGKRAMHLLQHGLGAWVEREAVLPALWRVNLLAEPEWAESVRDDLGRADLLILALADPDEYSQALEDCVEFFLGSPHATLRAVLTSLGTGHAWNIALQEQPRGWPEARARSAAELACPPEPLQATA